MNCKHVQELLPLYVGGDLEEKQAGLVATHVRSCADCAGSAEEYRESQQLLQLYTPPPVSESVYTGIRQRVLQEIQQESISPALPQLIADLFRPRIRWAFASALVIAVSVLAFYFIANRQIEPEQLADSRPSINGITADKEPKAGPQAGEVAATPPPSPSTTQHDPLPQRSTGQRLGRHTAIAEPGKRNRQPKPETNRDEVAEPSPSVAVHTLDNRSVNAKVSPETASAGGNLVQPGAVSNRDSVTSTETLRVEMQTKDRNIRIIWFSPQRSKQNPPGKSTKGNQEVRSYV